MVRTYGLARWDETAVETVAKEFGVTGERLVRALVRDGLHRIARGRGKKLADLARLAEREGGGKS